MTDLIRCLGAATLLALTQHSSDFDRYELVHKISSYNTSSSRDNSRDNSTSTQLETITVNTATTVTTTLNDKSWRTDTTTFTTTELSTITSTTTATEYIPPTTIAKFALPTATVYGDAPHGLLHPSPWTTVLIYAILFVLAASSLWLGYQLWQCQATALYQENKALRKDCDRKKKEAKIKEEARQKEMAQIRSDAKDKETELTKEVERRIAEEKKAAGDINALKGRIDRFKTAIMEMDGMELKDITFKSEAVFEETLKAWKIKRDIDKAFLSPQVDRLKKDLDESSRTIKTLRTQNQKANDRAVKNAKLGGNNTANHDWVLQLQDDERNMKKKVSELEDKLREKEDDLESYRTMNEEQEKRIQELEENPKWPVGNSDH